MMLFEKFGVYQPLNRQRDRYAREGVDLSLSTLADQVGTCTAALMPLYLLIEAHVLGAKRLLGDDTTVPVLAKTKTDTRRIWIMPCSKPVLAVAGGVIFPTSGVEYFPLLLASICLGLAPDRSKIPKSYMRLPVGRAVAMKKLEVLMMILDLHRQGLKDAVIAGHVRVDRKTVRKYIASGLEPPCYGPREPRARTIDQHVAYLRSRLAEYPGLTAQRLLREIAARGYTGGYSMVRDEVRALRPAGSGKGFAVRFETLPGEQAQVDFAQVRVSFAAEPGVVHIVWLFSMVLGYSRLIWGRFVDRQTMQTVLACHKGPFEAFGGVPRQILYDRMKTAVIGEDADGQVVYNRTLGDLAHHYGFLLPVQGLPSLSSREEGQGRAAVPVHPRGLLPGRLSRSRRSQPAVQRLAGRCRQPRLHATTGRVVNEAFARRSRRCCSCR